MSIQNIIKILSGKEQSITFTESNFTLKSLLKLSYLKSYKISIKLVVTFS